MQQELYVSKLLQVAEDYRVKSVHAEWDGKKAEAQRFGRLCAEQYLKVLSDEKLTDIERAEIYWRAVLQHQEVRRQKIALELAKEALNFIGDNEALTKHKFMFESVLSQ